MITEKELLNEWDFVRKNFFPRWDRKKQWTVVIKPDLPGQGECRTEMKEIWIAETNALDDLRFLLIHEICHNWGGGMHANGWQQRMKKTVEKATSLGLHDLAEKLGAEINSYASTPFVIRAPIVYGWIEDWTFENPEVDFETIIRCAAQDAGMYPKEFLSRYKRAKRVYETAKKEASQVPF